MKMHTFVLLHRIEKIRSKVHCNTKKNDKLALSEEKDAKSEFCALSGTDPDPASLLNFESYRGKMLVSLKGTDASKQAEDSLAYTARLDWPKKGKIFAPPIW